MLVVLFKHYHAFTGHKNLSEKFLRVPLLLPPQKNYWIIIYYLPAGNSIKCENMLNLSVVSSKRSTTGQFQSDLSGNFSREEEAWHEPSARPRASLWIFCKQKHFGASPVKVIPAVVLTALTLCSGRKDKNHTTWTKGGKKEEGVNNTQTPGKGDINGYFEKEKFAIQQTFWYPHKVPPWRRHKKIKLYQARTSFPFDSYSSTKFV